MLLVNFLTEEKEEPLCPSECIYGQFSYPLGLALCWGFSINRGSPCKNSEKRVLCGSKRECISRKWGDTLKSTVRGTGRTQLRTDRTQQALARKSKMVSSGR